MKNSTLEMKIKAFKYNQLLHDNPRMGVVELLEKAGLVYNTVKKYFVIDDKTKRIINLKFNQEELDLFHSILSYQNRKNMFEPSEISQK